MPIPPENATNNVAALTGMDPQVFTHNHSPGFEILPNGDALAIYFSTPPGKAEADPTTSFVQARLRYGAEEWDLPELFFKTENFNDQSGLLWNDNGTIRFFGGGRGRFRLGAVQNGDFDRQRRDVELCRCRNSTAPATNYTAQPITSAFRGAGSAPFISRWMATARTSFLWRSDDDGIHWHDMGGRTGGRHSVIVPLDDKGDLLSIGGKNSQRQRLVAGKFLDELGRELEREHCHRRFRRWAAAQRPSLIRLADGNLFFVSDAYLHKARSAAAGRLEIWQRLLRRASRRTTALRGASKLCRCSCRIMNAARIGTLGYVTARQAPNGVIHILTTETQPCLHYELNEAWIFSDAGDIAPETSGGMSQKVFGKLSERKSAFAMERADLSEWPLSARRQGNGFLRERREAARSHLRERPQNRHGNLLVGGWEKALELGA